MDGKTTDFTYTKEQGENEFLGTCNYFRSSATEFQTLLAKTGILSDPVFSRLSGNQGYRLTEQLNNVPDAEFTDLMVRLLLRKSSKITILQDLVVARIAAM